MTYREIFDDIVDIMKNDSATCLDIAGTDPAPFRERIADDMSRLDFYLLVKEYLYSFGLTGHLDFYAAQKDEEIKYNPFSVKRYNDCLYITYARKESGCEKGDIILELDGMTISEVSEKYHFMLTERNPDRQTFEWTVLMNMLVKKIKILHSSTQKTEIMDYTQFSTPDESDENAEFYFKKLSDDTTLIRLPHFLEKEPNDAVFEEFKKFRKKCRYLIFDVRGNRGGNDSFFFGYLPYCFPRGIHKYPAENFHMQKFYSERNCRQFTELINKSKYPDDVKKSLIDELVKKSGTGWSEHSKKNYFTEAGKKGPKKIFILTDEKCGSSGDSFVHWMSISPKVTVIGRPTRGINDYSNICTVYYEDFSFVYPMSRQEHIDKGIRFMGKGHPVDIFVPWTPENLERDIELEKALEIINKAKR